MSAEERIFFAKEILRTTHQGAVWNRRVRTLSERIGALIPDTDPLTGLDVGAGNGEIAWNIIRTHPGMAIEGADILLRSDSRINIVRFDGRKLPFADKSFDFAMLIDVLHHTKEPSALLAECARVSRKFIVLKDHLCESRWDDMRLRFMDWFGNRSYGVNLAYNYFSKGRWETLFKGHGLCCSKIISDLRIYPRPFSYIFDTNIHFIAKLDIE